MTWGRALLCQICLWNHCWKPLNPIRGQRAQPIHDRGWWAASMLKHLYMLVRDAQRDLAFLSTSSIFHWYNDFSLIVLERPPVLFLGKFPVNFSNQFRRSSKGTVWWFSGEENWRIKLRKAFRHAFFFFPFWRVRPPFWITSCSFVDI